MDNPERDVVISVVVIGLDLSFIGITTYNIAWEILNLIFGLSDKSQIAFLAYLLLSIPIIFLDIAISYSLKHRVIEIEKRGIIAISFFFFSLIASLIFLSFNIVV